MKNPAERYKKFKSSKDGLMSKLKEIDSVCGSTSVIVIVNTAKECAYYQVLPFSWITQLLDMPILDLQSNMKLLKMVQNDSSCHKTWGLTLKSTMLLIPMLMLYTQKGTIFSNKHPKDPTGPSFSQKY